MSTVVIRSKNSPAKGILALSDDAQRRAREYLESRGYQLDRIPPLIWPDDAVSAYRRDMYAPWHYTTRADIRRKRQEDAKHVLWFKREYGVTQRRALYVWVFWCPGVGGFVFRGWWTYLIGLKGQHYGGGYKGEVREGGDLFNQIKALFPVENPHPLFAISDDEWMPLFAKQYQRGYWCGKPQGKAPVWAEVEGNSIRKLLSRAEWPKVEV